MTDQTPKTPDRRHQYGPAQQENMQRIMADLTQRLADPVIVELPADPEDRPEGDTA
jgi:hypothetical protein